MTKVVNIKADGSLTILLDDLTVITSVDDPLLPSGVAEGLVESFSSMSSQGVSEVHMEQDTFRTFTHTVKAGLVEAQDSVTDPVFSVVVAAKADLAEVYKPQVEEVNAHL